MVGLIVQEDWPTEVHVENENLYLSLILAIVTVYMYIGDLLTLQSYNYKYNCRTGSVFQFPSN